MENDPNKCCAPHFGALITRGTVNADVAGIFGVEKPFPGRRYPHVILVLSGETKPLDAVMGLKDALGVIERKPPGKILVIVSPETAEDTALAAFAAVKSLARETAMPANCINAIWLKTGKLPGWRAPVDLWQEAKRLVHSIFALDSTTGQVFVVGVSCVSIPL